MGERELRMGYIERWVRERERAEGGIYRAMGERELRVGQWNNRRQWNVEVGRRRQTF